MFLSYNISYFILPSFSLVVSQNRTCVKRKTKQLPLHGHGSAGSPVIFLILFPPKFLIRFRFQILAGTKKEDFFLRSVFVADEKTKATGNINEKDKC